MANEEMLNYYYRIISHPLITESTWALIDSENTITFIVDRRANKLEIKEAIENIFNVKVAKINTAIDRFGKKKAFIRLSPEFLAADLAIKLNIF